MNVVARKKSFTVEQANQTLPLVRVIVADIMALYKEVSDRRQRLMEIRQVPGGRSRNELDVYSEEVAQIEEDLEKDIERLREFVEELEELGVELKDPTIGLIDFPSRRDGRDVYLCWKHGEGDVDWWHELETGLQGRQRLAGGDLADETAADGN